MQKDPLASRFSDTAILVFSRTSKEESHSKRYSRVPEKNITISRVLLNHTLSVCKQSGIVAFLLTEKEQRGQGFGEKLLNAFQDIFEKGYQQVICVGNDCPSLKPQDLEQAAYHLRKGRLVIGPCFDGGMYLLGLSRDVIEPHLFLQTTWQQGKDLAAFLKWADDRERDVFLLPKRADVDHVNVLKTLGQIHQLPADIVSALKAVLKFTDTPSALYSHDYFRQPVFSSRSLRAPPGELSGNFLSRSII